MPGRAWDQAEKTWISALLSTDCFYLKVSRGWREKTWTNHCRTWAKCTAPQRQGLVSRGACVWVSFPHAIFQFTLLLYLPLESAFILCLFLSLFYSKKTLHDLKKIPQPVPEFSLTHISKWNNPKTKHTGLLGRSLGKIKHTRALIHTRGEKTFITLQTVLKTGYFWTKHAHYCVMLP